MRKMWTDQGWDDYTYWQTQDRKTLRKINELVKSIERDGADKGLGNPEKLKHNLSGWSSRMIDDKNRLVYRAVSDNILEIAQCRGHYGDK